MSLFHLRKVQLPMLAALVSLGTPLTLVAQEHAHMQMPMQMPMPMPKTSPAPQVKPDAKARPGKKEAQHHAHGAEPQSAPAPEPAKHDMDMSGMDMSNMPGMTMPMPASGAPGMEDVAVPPGYEPRIPVPPLTAADRAAVFEDGGEHPAHDNTIQSFTLLNRLETWSADRGTGLEWEGQGWVGTDLNRLWFRSEGERTDGRLDAADVEFLYGRAVARWWDLVAGVRHDFKPGRSQDFAAVGIVGLAPQKFEVDATAYVGSGGQTALRLEAEREVLLTNRLILQPLVELNAFGQDDRDRAIGSGVSTIEAGLRLRYEVTRRFAPYVGITLEKAFGQTADYRRDEGEDVTDTRFVAGIRIWF